jgi:cell wall-associated NlpC family hydrolase
MRKRVLGVMATIAISIPVAGITVGAPATSAYAATGAPAAFAGNQERTAARDTAGESAAGEAASYVKSLEGDPYVYGGTSPSGFDCSGLTQYVYAHAGSSIPRTAEEQFQDFRQISKSQAGSGDLVFFHDTSDLSSYVYHVGVYEGGNDMVAASSGAGHVTSESITWAGDTVTFGTLSQ